MQEHYQVTLTPGLTERLQSIDTIKADIKVRRSQTNGNLTQAIQQKLRFLWTYHSNAIEGSRLSLGDTIFLHRYGGVCIVYRKRIEDSPAYRHNHEELQKALEEGVQLSPCVSFGKKKRKMVGVRPMMK